jgi:hypothetical protein
MRTLVFLGSLAAAAAGAAALTAGFTADAASQPAAALNVREQNLTPAGNIRVHEQGTASVNVANTWVPVREQGEPGIAVKMLPQATRVVYNEHALTPNRQSDDIFNTEVTSEIEVSVDAGEVDLLFEGDGPGTSETNQIGVLAAVDHPVVIPLNETVFLNRVRASCAPAESACVFSYSLIGRG